jgi:hypothetical protein
MSTSTKLIIATMTAAVLSSPVMADTVRHAHGHAAPSATTVTDETHGSTGPTQQGRFNTPFSEDCIHVTFPQCTGGN